MFIERPASKQSLSKRKLLHGIGVNDASYIISNITEDVLSLCPFYRVWNSMIERCYSVKYQEKQPTYKGCSVCEEWLTFSVFKEWMRSKDWRGKQLDKDLLLSGNKQYAPNTCIFISKFLNTIFCDTRARRGAYPIGVSLKKESGKFSASCSFYGKVKCLGYFETIEEAAYTYKKAKHGYILEVASNYNGVIKKALVSRADKLKGDMNVFETSL